MVYSWPLINERISAICLLRAGTSLILNYFHVVRILND